MIFRFLRDSMFWAVYFFAIHLSCLFFSFVMGLKFIINIENGVDHSSFWACVSLLISGFLMFLISRFLYSYE